MLIGFCFQTPICNGGVLGQSGLVHAQFVCIYDFHTPIVNPDSVVGMGVGSLKVIRRVSAGCCLKTNRFVGCRMWIGLLCFCHSRQ